MAADYALWGSGGFIGSRLFDPTRHVPVDSKSTHADGVSLPPSIKGIVWCAGWAGKRNVDEVECDPMRSYHKNVFEPMCLAFRCRVEKKRILFISSGCIFDGLNSRGAPHAEEDTPNFCGTVYLKHQWKRQRALIEEYAREATIFRIRVPFDGSHHPRNTLHKLAHFPAVWDKPQSFTWLPDLARAVRLWEEGTIDGGVWHVTQPHARSNYELVRKHLNPRVGKISGGDRPDPTMAAPRSSGILDCSKIQRMMPLTPIDEAFASAASVYLRS